MTPTEVHNELIARAIISQFDTIRNNNSAAGHKECAYPALTCQQPDSFIFVTNNLKKQPEGKKS